MRNIKDQIYEALLTVHENVSDVYPKDWENLPAIQLTEENNSVVERTDNKEQRARVSYKIDIYHNRSTSQIACDVDNAVAALGFVRTHCGDAPDPSWKHKVMRYEGEIDMDSDIVYWNR